MAINLEITVQNGKAKITVGGGQANVGGSGGDSSGDSSSQTASGRPGGDSSGDASSGTASGSPSQGGGCCCCAPLVIGPIVVSGMQGGGGGAAGGDSSGDSSSSTASGPPGGDSSGDPSSGTASGGPHGSGCGCCCCAPTVIGPIVFTDCCSGSSQTSKSRRGCVPKQVTANPPTGVVNGPNPLSQFSMEAQLQSDWCWSAVAVAVNAFLGPPPAPTFAALAGGAWTQPTLATALFEQVSPGQQLLCTDPTQASSPSGCDQPEALDVALEITKNLRSDASPDDGYRSCSYLTVDSLKQWFSANLPVCARIVWRGGGAHFIALAGWAQSASGQQMVNVYDPASASPQGTVAPVLVACDPTGYNAIVSNYPGNGYWSDTYLVTP